jgi:aryl-alcohol dehydrogenase-like predicted oxidoreductase
MNTLSTRRLGATDVQVSPIGLGCMQFAGRGFVERIYQAGLDQAAATSVVTSALAAGITWFDSAEMYGRGRADRTLAAAVRDAGSPDGTVTLATKWNPLLRTAASIERGIDPDLRSLRHPLLHQIHWPYGSLSSLRAQLQAMARLYRAGEIQAVGVSNFTARQLRKASAILQAEGVPLATNQVQASLLCRSIESNGVLDAARELGVTLVAYFPLKSGILTGKFHDHPDLLTTVSRMRRRSGGLSQKTLRRTAPLIAELRAIGDRYLMSAGQVALNWLVTYYGDTVVAIPGASTGWHAVDNAAAMRFRLTDDERGVLADLSSRCEAKNQDR